MDIAISTIMDYNKEVKTLWVEAMAKAKKLMGVQQCLITPDKDLKAILEYICLESNKLHNCAVYYARITDLKIDLINKTFLLAYEEKKSKAAKSIEFSVKTAIVQYT